PGSAWERDPLPLPSPQVRIRRRRCTDWGVPPRPARPLTEAARAGQGTPAMIEAHFGLLRRSFTSSVTPDQASYYPATTHEHALARLLAALSDGEGILVLCGSPGLGKTLLAHCLLDRVGVRPGEGGEIEPVFLAGTPSRDRVGLLQALLYDLSLP